MWVLGINHFILMKKISFISIGGGHRW